jgi:V/A-type H+-transporting ATPase subunit E
MTEDLQNLLDRIRKDGLDRANEQKDNVLTEAKAQADKIVAEAKATAEKRIADAEKEAERFARQGEISLHQAARNVVLAVEEAVQDSLSRVVRDAVKARTNADLLKTMIPQIVKAYADAGGESDLQVLLSPEDQEKLADAALADCAAALTGGLDIRSDRGVLSGFRLTVVDENMEHDFTGEAISNAICGLLRPRLAKIMREAREQEETAPDDTQEEPPADS